MDEMRWREAIVEVLRQSAVPLHVSTISQRVIDYGYRRNVGATPDITISSIISQNINQIRENGVFFRERPGVYGLIGVHGHATQEQTPSTFIDSQGAKASPDQQHLINAFGMFWLREWVNWSQADPGLWGKQQTGSEKVNFSAENAVYLLYDGNRIVYVARTTDRPLGLSIREHTRDRLSGRWNRFSWFGARGVGSDGVLEREPTDFDISDLMATLSALLVEGLEPSQNRGIDEGFGAAEFLQELDPEIERQQEDAVLEKIRRSRS